MVFVLDGFVRGDTADPCRHAEGEAVAFGYAGTEVRQLFELHPRRVVAYFSQLGAEFGND